MNIFYAVNTVQKLIQSRIKNSATAPAQQKIQPPTNSGNPI